MPRAKSSKTLANGESSTAENNKPIAKTKREKKTQAPVVEEIVLKKGRKKKSAETVIPIMEEIYEKPVEKRGRKKIAENANSVDKPKKETAPNDKLEKTVVGKKIKTVSVLQNGTAAVEKKPATKERSIKSEAVSVNIPAPTQPKMRFAIRFGFQRRKKKDETQQIIEHDDKQDVSQKPSPPKARGRSKNTATTALIKELDAPSKPKKASKISSPKKEILATDPKTDKIVARGKKRAKPEKMIADCQEETVEHSTPKKKPKKLEKPEKASKAARSPRIVTPADHEEAAIDLMPPLKQKASKKTTKSEATRTRGRKRIATMEDVLADGDDNSSVDNKDEAKPAKVTKKSTPVPSNPSATKYNKDDFKVSRPVAELDANEPYNLKISSWNVAGLRSWLKKDELQFLDYEEPDIFCLQETKCTDDQLPKEARIPGYHPYWHCLPGGYAGVAVYSKIMPIHVQNGIGNTEFDNVGRIITAEYEKFYLINVYVPNSGRKLVNLETRMRWEKLFQGYVQKLDARKPVVICGDMNVSHQEIDLANPKTNTRNAGFTQEERDKLTELLALGYVDTFRHLYPKRTGAYTFWTYMGNARARNVGWRLDYFIVSERFVRRVVDNCIRAQCLGSDHCPITLYLKL